MLVKIFYLLQVATFINFFVANSHGYPLNEQVGRSGRFGHLGLAVNLITYEDRFNLYVTHLQHF